MTRASAQGRRSAWLSWLLLVLAVVAIAGVVLGLGMCSARSRGVIGTVAELEQAATSWMPWDPPTAVEGRVWLEVPEPETPESEPEPEAPEPEEPDAVDSTTTAGNTDALPPPSNPPALEPATDCTVRAFIAGEPVGDPARCDEAGRYRLRLPDALEGEVFVEITVPGHLRAVLPAAAVVDETVKLVDVALGVGFLLEGDVVDRDGEPIAGASVVARPVPDLDEAVPWRTVTDEDGVFRFDTLPVGPVRLHVEHEGYAPATVDAIVPEDEVGLALDPLRQIAGLVVGPYAAEARVRLQGTGVWPAREVETDAEGRFVFDDVPDGIYALEAIVTEPLPLASVPLENVTPEVEVTLALTQAKRVHVRVVDPTGQGVPNAAVTLGSGHVSLLQRGARADEHGHAWVGPVIPGPYVVRADAEGWLPAQAVELEVSAAAADENPADAPPVELVLRPPSLITGTVVDGAGRPVAGAEIEVTASADMPGAPPVSSAAFSGAWSPAGSLGVTAGPVPEIPQGGSAPAPTSTTSDAAGQFRLVGLQPGIYRLKAWHGRFAGSAAVDVDVSRAGASQSVTLRLREGHPLTGRVLDGNRRPVAQARVLLQDGTVLVTDDRGVFDAGVQRGEVRLDVTAPGMAPSRVQTVVEERAVDLEIVLEEADAILRGRVRDEAGRPIEDAHVVYSGTSGVGVTRVAQTAEDGTFEIAELASGPARVSVEHPSYLAHTQTIELDRALDLEITLQSGWAIDVLVEEARTRRGIAGARVQAGAQVALTDDEGRAVVGGLSGSSAVVQVEASGYPSSRRTVSEPTRGSASTTFELAPGGSIEGIVTDYRGDPVGGAAVVVWDAEQGQELARVRSTARGRWSATGLPEGDVWLVAEPPVAREHELASVAQGSDVLASQVTRGVELRFDRR